MSGPRTGPERNRPGGSESLPATAILRRRHALAYDFTPDVVPDVLTDVITDVRVGP